MILDIFKINDIPPNSTGVLWSVSWPHRGVVKIPKHLKIIWDAAWNTKPDLVSLALADDQTYTVYWTPDIDSPEFFKYVYTVAVEKCGGVTAVGFNNQKQAEQFVEELERHITWRSLAREYDTSN